jgi:hypothetical protein
VCWSWVGGGAPLPGGSQVILGHGTVPEARPGGLVDVFSPAWSSCSSETLRVSRGAAAPSCWDSHCLRGRGLRWGEGEL